MWLEAVAVGLDPSVLTRWSLRSVRIGFLCTCTAAAVCRFLIAGADIAMHTISCVRGLVEELTADCK